MKYLILLVSILFLFSCGRTSVEIKEEGIKGIEKANVQNEAIADSISPDKPIHAAGIKDNTNTIRQIVAFNAKNENTKTLLTELANKYEQTLAAKTAAWENEAQALQTQLHESQETLSKAKKESEQKGFWLKVLGGLGVAWGLVKTLRHPLKLALNSVVPGAGKVIDWISLAGNTYEEKETLATAVRGADEGIKAAEKLERNLNTLLDNKLETELKKLTNGKTGSVVDYLKDIASKTQLDEGRLGDVEKMLKKLRDTKKTSEAETAKVI